MALQQLPSLPTGTDKYTWNQLIGAGTALVIHEAAHQFDGLTLIVTDSVRKADQLESELAFFRQGAAAPEQAPLLHFPDQETLPYDFFSPHQDITSERLKTLCKLPQVNNGILIVPWQVGDKLDIDQLRSRLGQAGYHPVDTVYEHGEYSVRGALIDVFPMGSETPIRIDLFDDEIESLRRFDKDSQLSTEQIEAIQLLPAREVPLDKNAIKVFKDNWISRFDGDRGNRAGSIDLDGPR